MKKLIRILVVVVLFVGQVHAQQTPAFHGAQAHKKHYNALYILNSGDTKHISGTLRNISNALSDPRLKDKLTIELVAFGDGVAVFEKNNVFDSTLQVLKNKGVILAQCENTVHERHIEKSQLLDYISYVPSGNGEIIIRQQEGWSTVHP